MHENTVERLNIMDPRYAAMMGAQFLSGYPDMSGAEFLSGDPFVSGYDMAGMADIAGAMDIAGDPVSALLGMGPDMSGFSLNPFHYLNKINPFHRGSIFRPTGGPSPAAAAAINAKLAQNGAAVVNHANSKARKTVSPVVATAVGGGLNAVITAQPQTLFRPERFVIPASIAPSFTIQDIKVGNVSQFPNTGDIPGEMFAQNSFDTGIRLDTVNPAINLSVAVTNITGGTLTFRAGFYGTLVQ